jgi:hypothetical protein
MERFDFAKGIKYGFQNAASPIGEGIQDLHNQILFWLIGIFVFVLMIAVMTFIMSSYEWEQPKKESLVKKVKEHLHWSTIEQVKLSIILFPSVETFLFTLYFMYVIYRFLQLGPCVGIVVEVLSDTLLRVEFISGYVPVNGTLLYVVPHGIIYNGVPMEYYSGVVEVSNDRVLLRMVNVSPRQVGNIVYAGQ